LIILQDDRHPLSAAHLSAGSVRLASAGRIHNRVEQSRTRSNASGPIDASVKNQASEQQLQQSVLVASPSTVQRLVRPQVLGNDGRSVAAGMIQPSGGPFEGSPVPLRQRWVSTKRIQMAFELLQHQPSSRATRLKPLQLRNKRHSCSILFHERSSFIAYLAATERIARAIPGSNAYRRGSDKLIR
jgi:hypothetical protein